MRSRLRPLWLAARRIETLAVGGLTAGGLAIALEPSAGHRLVRGTSGVFTHVEAHKRIIAFGQIGATTAFGIATTLTIGPFCDGLSKFVRAKPPLKEAAATANSRGLILACTCRSDDCSPETFRL